MEHPRAKDYEDREDFLEDTVSYWAGLYKQAENDWMHLKDQYTELVRAALGDTIEYDAWFGDPLGNHEEVLRRVVERCRR